VRLLFFDGTKAELSHPSESARQAIALTKVKQSAVRKTSAGKTFRSVLMTAVVVFYIAAIASLTANSYD
jgi:hypothetical protein